MSDTVIRVEGLGKSYLLGHHSKEKKGYVSLRDVISKKAKLFFQNKVSLQRKKKVNHKDGEEFWALKDINFEIKQGDRVGIIGRNGAGKSTLLKILSRITEPTKGRVSIKGRVASLLEVGTGFHPELTGRENIYLNGAILGMSRKEINSKFDEVVTFAEVEKFLDTPVKRYSSGMYTRLAFAVAAHLDPDILVVDEVLAVGDLAFQKKCMEKMEAVSKGGSTVLFVSHNVGAITSLCKDAILLHEGKLKKIGSATEIVAEYSQDGLDEVEWIGNAGDDLIRLRRTWVRSLDADGLFRTDAPLEVGIEVEILKQFQGLVMGFNLYSEYGHPLALCLYDDHLSSPAPIISPGILTHRFRIPPNNLSHGKYRIQFDVGVYNIARIIERQGALTFSLENISGSQNRFIVPHEPRFTSLFRPEWSRFS